MEDSQSGRKGRGWHGDSQGHAQAGRQGGEKVSQDRTHMVEIGRKGGHLVSRDREHMAEIGRMGGRARGKAIEARSQSTRAHEASLDQDDPQDAANRSHEEHAK